MQVKRNYGRLISQRVQDPRLRFLESRQSLDAMPPLFALPSFNERVLNLDQEAIGSCGPNSYAECIMWNEAVQGIAVRPISRLGLYYWTRVLMGTVGQDSGVDNGAMCKAANQYGLLMDEKLWPYNIASFRQKPPATPATKIIDYAGVIQSLGQMKGTLYGSNGTDGDPFIFGFDVFSQIESEQAAQDGVVQNPAPTEQPIGGHDVTIYGWNDTLYGGAGGFLFRNHWRAGNKWWGVDGNGTIPYAYALNAQHAGDFKVIRTVPGGTPVPPDPAPGRSLIEGWDMVCDALIASDPNQKDKATLRAVKRMGEKYIATLPEERHPHFVLPFQTLPPTKDNMFLVEFLAGETAAPRRCPNLLGGEQCILLEGHRAECMLASGG